ncbi:MAG: hypothetical protein ACK4UN_17735 [Limisphaerales bacterium]
MRTLNIATSWNPVSFSVKLERAGTIAGQKSVAHIELQNLKARMLSALLATTEEPELCRQFTLAANEAAAIAWNKPYPVLMFPCLFEEKVRELKLWFRRQQRVLVATQALFGNEQGSGSRADFSEPAKAHCRDAAEMNAAFDAVRLAPVPVRRCAQRSV